VRADGPSKRIVIIIIASISHASKAIETSHERRVYFLAVFSAISLAISSFVLPSVVIARLLAATISGSVSALVEGTLVVATDDTSFVTLSNSFLARPIDLASSGSFCGPQRKTTSKIATTINHSYPIRAKRNHIRTMRSAQYKNGEPMGNVVRISWRQMLRNTFKRRRFAPVRSVVQPRPRGGQGRLLAEFGCAQCILSCHLFLSE
jgi:hypothetical protein